MIVRNTPTALLAAALALSALASTPLAAQEIPFQRALGGNVETPVAIGERVYLPSAAVIYVVDYSDPSAPVLRGSTETSPAPGLLVGLASHGSHLYGAYTTYSGDAGGVLVYSLADPDRPALVATIDDYTDKPYRAVQGIAVAQGHLYLFDGESGLHIAGLDNPAAPDFQHWYPAFGAHQNTHVDGHLLYSHGRSWLGQTTLTVFDLSTPTAPVEAGFSLLDGINNFRLHLQGRYAYGFGLGLSVHDLNDPADIIELSQVPGPAVSQGLVLGAHAYALGGDGIGVWSVANPAAPLPLATAPVDSFLTDAVLVHQQRALFATRTDRVVVLDTSSPQQPTIASEVLVPGGTDPYDIAVVGDTALILSGSYGLHLADADTLTPLARFEPALPAKAPYRAYEQLAVAGDRAYLTAWGYGLLIVDISDPRAPVELSRVEYPFATAIDVEGDFAYVGRTTEGGEVLVVDVGNPAQPQVRGSIVTSKAQRLVVHQGHVFVADETFGPDGGGGLRVIDVGNPDLPVLAGFYNDDCPSAADLAIDRARAIVYLSCDDGLHVVDVSTPGQPQRLARVDGQPVSVDVRDDRVYVADMLGGLVELDVSDPQAPLVAASSVHPPVPASRVRALADGRIAALRNSAGIWLFGAADDVLFRNGFEAD